jgi:hypothetical protein
LGQFHFGVQVGKGNFTWSNGDVYIGDFKENIRNGYGMIIYKNGEKYEG